ncbi:uncharacterized protein LOC143367813 isoform X2 [Andrena cerasifolii]
MSYVEEGTKARKTASTLQNPSSSRSHALLTIAVSPETSSVAAASSSAPSSPRRKSEPWPRGGSKLRLVDLAGSESAATCSGVHRLKEGANINKSLVALGNVISALAERGSTGSGPGRRFIPYRDSSLTWLLKDALGGNATTIMLATISPASGSYNETAHTLRFAQRAQSVVNRPVVNEDPVARIIRELRAEVSRLRSLLLEKSVEPAGKPSCCCRRSQFVVHCEDPEDAASRKETDGDPKKEFQEGPVEVRTEEGGGWSRSIVPLRRSNSSESVTASEAGSPSAKRYGSCESLAARGRLAGYSRARVTELNEEEDEVGEILRESVFVDIPTLVAVLIKPDDSLQGTSAQIEEICSDEVSVDAIDDEFIGPGSDRGPFEDTEKLEIAEELSSSLNSCHASLDNEADVYRNVDCPRASPASRLKEKPRFRKQDSVDVLSPSITSNLHTSKRFGSVEAIQRKREPVFPLERSHTNLERRSTPKKLNNIREIDDQKAGNRSIWRGSKEQLQRKGSNDSDKSLKDSNGQTGGKGKNYVRKPSLENLKRKTSKDSSSSSSKDEQILISSLTREKLLSRKDSSDQDSSQSRTHTPIQRAKRAEIVAAVTERLYSSRKASEDASGLRSPPEGTDVKSVARMRLQEISRKMLGKRRRVCVDTQTDPSRAVRMKDTASLTETPQVILQDVGVLTDDHEACETMVDRRTPTLRVKEIATLTDKPKMNIARCKDVGCLANDLEEFDYQIHSPRNDSGILSDDTQNYAESNVSSTEVSDLCHEADRRVVRVESSTNTFLSPGRSFAVQTPLSHTFHRRTAEKAPVCSRQCCNSAEEPQKHPEKSVISISLPETISITIESTNLLESRIAVMDGLEQEKVRSSTKDAGAQTEEVRLEGACDGAVCCKDLSRSTPTQTDSRVFRIENIFQDPNNASKGSKVDAVGVDREEGSRIRNSITFRNSLGTSYAPKEEEEAALHGEGFIREGLITEAFITKKRGSSFKRGPSAIVYDNPWRNWPVAGPGSARNSVDYSKGLEEVPSSWRLKSSESPVAGLTSSVNEDESSFLQSRLESTTINGTSEMKTSSYSVAELNSNLDHDHSFSDDSLDYNESNLLQLTVSKLEDCELRESLCPPDVVAHTKKDCAKPSGTVDVEESSGDFEDSHVEFPRKRPTEPMEAALIHDYKSLILGRPCSHFEDASEEAEASIDCGSNSGKKKVSFSSCSVSEGTVDESETGSKQDSKSTLKSIIKKRKKRNATETLAAARSCEEEAGDSLQEKRDASMKGYGDLQENSSKGTSREDRESMCSRRECRQNRKKVKFFVEDRSRSTCSESDSCENAEYDEEEDVPFDRATRNILEEYLSEAVTFMRNLNSINEYVNVASTIERHTTSTCCRRGRRGGTRRRSCCSGWDRDYAELLGRRVSPKDDTDDYLRENDDIFVSTESYEECLRGMRRLEDCIRRADRHNELLREKYGVDCESAGARLSLASPSTDPAAPIADDTAIHRGTGVPHAETDQFIDPRLVDLRTTDSSGGWSEKDDLEKRIFDQLMNAANSARYRSSGKLQGRFSKPSDIGSGGSTYSKLREKHEQSTKESFVSGDVFGSLNLGETAEDDPQDFTRYEIRGNLSVARSSPTQGNVDDELDHLAEEDLLPLKRFDLASWSADASGTDRRSGRISVRDDSSDSFSRSGTTDSGIVGDAPPGKMSSRTNHTVQRALTDDVREMLRELDDYSRKIRDSSSKVPCIDRSSEAVHCREKLKYPGSPRARFLELLRERRRIVESSRGTGAS